MKNRILFVLIASAFVFLAACQVTDTTTTSATGAVTRTKITVPDKEFAATMAQVAGTAAAQAATQAAQAYIATHQPKSAVPVPVAVLVP